MGSEYKRGATYWIDYRGPDGRRIRESSGAKDRREARRVLAQREAEARAGTWSPHVRGGPMALADYGDRWAARESTPHDDRQRWRDHVKPRIGSQPIASIRPRHVHAFIDEIRATHLAPRTQLHVCGVLRSILRDAVIDEVIEASPYVLRPGILPQKVDADPEWRELAVFTREEFELLISHPRIPLDRRTFYALELFGCMRFGEAAGRRWRHYDPTARPLGRLAIGTQYEGRATKTKRPRAMPVHPVLAAMLAEWRLDGFGSYFGRSPSSEDFIVPSRRGVCRSVRHGLRRLHEDLERIGLRRRRQHDSRRTFISLARADGASGELLRYVTHGPKGDIMDAYTTPPWHALCDQVACLRVGRRGVSAIGSTSQSTSQSISESNQVRGMNGKLRRGGRDSKA